MIELATLFIPVAIICKNSNADSCTMIQYKGYFHSQQQCYQHVDSDMRFKLSPKEKKHVYVDFWCVSIDIEKIDKKFLPKSI